MMDVRNNKLRKRTGLFWLTVWDVLVHGGWFCCFGPVIRLRIMVGDVWWSALLIPRLLENGRRKQERAQHSTVLSEGGLPYDLKLPTRPHPLNNSTEKTQQVLNTWKFGGIPEPNYSTISLPCFIFSQISLP